MTFCKGCKYYKKQHKIIVDFSEFDKVELLKSQYVPEKKSKNWTFIRKNCCMKESTKIQYIDWFSDKSYILYAKAEVVNANNTCQNFKANKKSTIYNIPFLKEFLK